MRRMFGVVVLALVSGVVFTADLSSNGVIGPSFTGNSRRIAQKENIDEERGKGFAPDKDPSGKELFQKNCSRCHSFDVSIVGPPLAKVLEKYRGNTEGLSRYIKDPVKVDPDYPAMPDLGLDEREAASIANYLDEMAYGAFSKNVDDVGFQQTIVGSVLRKTSGKLVFSLGSFEIGDRESLWVRNKKTGEEMSVGVSSVYDESSYSVVLDEDTYAAIAPEDYECFLRWEIPGDIDGMGKVLHGIHEYQNSLRKRLGASITPSGRFVSSRIVIGKLQKFHKIGAQIVRKFFEKGRRGDRYDLFRFPITFEIGFNPDLVQSFGGNMITYEKALVELIYEEFGRTFWYEYGFGEGLIEIIFNAPLTLKNLALREDREVYRFFTPAPYVRVPPEVLNAAWYISRQGITEDVGEKIKFGLFKDSLINDRDVLKRTFTSGWTIGAIKGSFLLSFTGPYVKPGDTIFLITEGGEKVPVRVQEADPSRPYSVTEPLPPDVISRFKTPAPVSMWME